MSISLSKWPMLPTMALSFMRDMWSAVMMLNYLGEIADDVSFSDCAMRIKNAYDAALIKGDTTRDLGGPLGTKEFASAVISNLN